MGVAIGTADDAVSHIVAGGIIAVLRLERAEDLGPAAEALRQGGVTTLEVSVASRDGLNALGPNRAMQGHGLLLGAGMVVSCEAAREAVRTGAQFITTPTLNPEIVRECREARVPVIAGAFTATAIVQAWNQGADLVKLFPAGPVGAGYVREILTVLPSVRLVPAGGIALEHVGEFILAGAAAVALGSEMIPEDALAGRQFGEITRRARAFVEAVQHARSLSAHPVQPVRPVEGPDVR